MKCYLLLVFLSLSLNIDAANKSTNIAFFCDLERKNISLLYKVRDLKIDVFNSDQEESVYSLEIKSEHDRNIYAETLVYWNSRPSEIKELWSFIFYKSEFTGKVNSLSFQKFKVKEIFKDEYLELRIKQSYSRAKNMGKCRGI